VPVKDHGHSRYIISKVSENGMFRKSPPPSFRQ
jgi:hypothetical protein